MSKAGREGGRTFSGETTIAAFKRGELRIDPDLLNEWTPLSTAIQSPAGGFWQDLGPAVHYADRVRNGGYAPGEAEEILRLTDPTTVAQYDALVDEYNAKLPGLMQTHDMEVARSLYERAMAIIEGK